MDERNRGTTLPGPFPWLHLLWGFYCFYYSDMIVGNSSNRMKALAMDVTDFSLEGVMSGIISDPVFNMFVATKDDNTM